jgi:hypothetical protein
MANVNPVDGIVYGFRLLGYLIVVFIAGGLLALIGQEIGDILGLLIAFMGSLTIFAGFAGIQYKIIADGVEQGIRASQGTAPEGEGLSGLPFVGDNRQGRRQGRTASGQQQQQQNRSWQQSQRNQGQRGQGQRSQGQRNQGQRGQGQRGQGQQGGTGNEGSSGRQR